MVSCADAVAAILLSFDILFVLYVCGAARAFEFDAIFIFLFSISIFHLNDLFLLFLFFDRAKKAKPLSLRCESV